MLRVRMLVAGLVTVGCGLGATCALGSTTPGWECIPTTAGQAVLSGGTGAAPSCPGGTTAVLAPTYVSSGVGGKPTVVFSTINVQVISGAGMTYAAVNGEGNLIIGYGENPGGFARTGSNDLIVGSNNGWTGYGELVGGANNAARGLYAAVFGISNSVSGLGSFAAGAANRAIGSESSVLGGKGNSTKGEWSSVLGGTGHHATTPYRTIPASNG